MPAIVDFRDALAKTTGGRRHLVLGNGFSIALFPDRFRYGSLLDAADFHNHPEARLAFTALNTTDFEVVIHALRQAVALASVYRVHDAVTEHMHRHAEALKELLVRAVAGSHPERPSDIPPHRYAACRQFLAHFVGEHRNEIRSGGKDLRGQIYTLNYDLLLYWTLLHTSFEENLFDFDAAPAEALQHDDGFRASADDPSATYVTWDAEDAANHQNIHFLHGALHLFDDGPELQKKCWERGGGVPLVDQIRAALAEGKFPLFVSEGDSQSKLTRIRHSGYLQRSLRSFAGICRSGQETSVFVYGHSLAPNDEHVLRQIEVGKVRRLFVSLYGDPSADYNTAIIRRADEMAASRPERFPLEIEFFDAAQADVWGIA